jgi:hypothetical protein
MLLLLLLHEMTWTSALLLILKLSIWSETMESGLLWPW